MKRLISLTLVLTLLLSLGSFGMLEVSAKTVVTADFINSKWENNTVGKDPYSAINIDSYSEFGAHQTTLDGNIGSDSALKPGDINFGWDEILYWLRYDNLDFKNGGAASVKVTTGKEYSSGSISVFVFDHTSKKVDRTYVDAGTTYLNQDKMRLADDKSDRTSSFKLTFSADTQVETNADGTYTYTFDLNNDQKKLFFDFDDIVIFANTLNLKGLSFGADARRNSDNSLKDPYAAGGIDIDKFYEYGGYTRDKDKGVSDKWGTNGSAIKSKTINFGWDDRLDWLRYNNIDFASSGADKLKITVTNASLSGKNLSLYVFQHTDKEVDRHSVESASDAYINQTKMKLKGDTVDRAPIFSLFDLNSVTPVQNEDGTYTYTYDMSNYRHRLNGTKDIILFSATVWCLKGISFEKHTLSAINPYDAEVSARTAFADIGGTTEANDKQTAGAAGSAIQTDSIYFGWENMSWVRYNDIAFGENGAVKLKLKLDAAPADIAALRIFVADSPAGMVDRTFRPYTNNATLYCDGGNFKLQGAESSLAPVVNTTFGMATKTDDTDCVYYEFDITANKSNFTGTKDIIIYSNCAKKLYSFQFTEYQEDITPVASFNFLKPDGQNMTEKAESETQWGWGTINKDTDNYLLYNNINFGEGEKLYRVQLDYNRGTHTVPCVVNVYVDNVFAGSMDTVNGAVWGSADSTPMNAAAIIKTNGTQDIKFSFVGEGCDVKGITFTEATVSIGDLTEGSKVTYTFTNAQYVPMYLILAKYNNNVLVSVDMENVEVDEATKTYTLTVAEKGNGDSVKAYIWTPNMKPIQMRDNL